MSTLHASVCMRVPANILMLTLHMLLASGLSYTRTSTCIPSMPVLLMSTFCMRKCVKVSLVYSDVTSHDTQWHWRFMHQCVRLHYMLMMMVYSSAYKPINPYKVAYICNFYWQRHLQPVCTPVCTGDVNAGMCMYMCLKVNKIQQPTLIIVTIDHCPIIIFFSLQHCRTLRFVCFFSWSMPKKNSPSTSKAKQQTMRTRKLAKDLSSRSNNKVFE